MKKQLVKLSIFSLMTAAGLTGLSAKTRVVTTFNAGYQKMFLSSKPVNYGFNMLALNNLSHYGNTLGLFTVGDIALSLGKTAASGPESAAVTDNDAFNMHALNISALVGPGFKFRLAGEADQPGEMHLLWGLGLDLSMLYMFWIRNGDVSNSSALAPDQHLTFSLGAGTSLSWIYMISSSVGINLSAKYSLHFYSLPIASKTLQDQREDLIQVSAGLVFASGQTRQ